MSMHLRAAAVAFAAWAVVAPADAGNLQIAPVSVDFAAGEKARTLTLKNMGAQPATIQLRVFRWRQEGGSDRLDPTTEIAAGPPMVSVPAGGEQIVRVMIRAVPDDGAQHTYRLLIDEIPVRLPGRVNVALRLSLPVFVGGHDAAPANVAWDLSAAPGGGYELVARNDGGRFARFERLELAIGAASSRSFGGYVLPGQERRWRVDVPGGARAGKASLRGSSDQRAIDVSLALQTRR